MTARARIWVRRYLPAELTGIVGALIAAHLALAVSANNDALAAIAGAWGETAAYYATMLWTERRLTRGALAAIRNLVMEFGLAEALDSALIRPTLMFAASRLLADPMAGVLVGKLASDVFFYVPAIAAFELRERYARRGQESVSHS
jgi:hypothetical protein